MSLYLKHRPATFEEVLGNEETVSALAKMVQSKDCPHSFLFSGPTGCGKTTLARIVAAELGAEGSGIREVDIADFRGIDTIRDIRQQSQYQPLEGSCIVWILDECHKLTGDAQNAMLKMLEDTPKHVFILLCTTEPSKLLPTVRNRCSQFEVKLLEDAQIMSLLKSIVKKEKQTLQKEVYDRIIMDAQGHARLALTVLDQVLFVEPEQRLELAKRHAEQASETIALCRALLDTKAGWKKVAEILKGLKSQDPEAIRRQVLGYAQAVLLNTDQPRAAVILELFMEPTYNSGFPAITYACYSTVKS